MSVVALLERGAHRAEIEAFLAPRRFGRRKLKRYLTKQWRRHNADVIRQARSGLRREPQIVLALQGRRPDV